MIGLVSDDDPGSEERPSERLEREELRLLAAATGDHLPIELAIRVDEIRRERSVFGGELPPAA